MKACIKLLNQLVEERGWDRKEGFKCEASISSGGLKIIVVYMAYTKLVGFFMNEPRGQLVVVEKGGGYEDMEVFCDIMSLDDVDAALLSWVDSHRKGNVDGGDV
jgi:hypothetical protein